MIYNVSHIWSDEFIITLAQAKSNLRIDHDLDDAEIQQMIYAAYTAVENHLNRILVAQGVTYQIEGSQSSFSFTLPHPEAPKSFGTVEAISSTGVIVASTAHTVELDHNVVTISDVKFATDITVSDWLFTINYTPTLLDYAINAAVYLTITHFYENRNAIVVGTMAKELPLGVKHLLSGYRNYPL